MPAYFLVDVCEVVDAAKLEDYRSRIRPVVEKFGGKYLVIGGKCEVVEGDWRPVLPVLIEFPSFARALEWYSSEEYRELKVLRLAATRGTGVFIEGL
jgi:uncharacterized protein (DUF1330 family)